MNGEFGLSWPGRREAADAAVTPSSRTMSPRPEQSLDWDRADHAYVSGDNLDVLKLLTPSYSGRVKMIYIDPPYNTRGNHLTYPDNFGSGGECHHSRWLSMMYPRLVLGRDLLSEDGVMFVSIDDHEVHHLRMLMDEVFAEDNFVAQIAWQSRQSVQNDTDISVSHEYVVGYARRRRRSQRRLKPANAGEWATAPGFACRPLPLSTAGFSNPDGDPRGEWKLAPFDAPNIRPNLTYAIVNPATGQTHWPPPGRCWRTGQAQYEQLLADDRIMFGRTGRSRPYLKIFLREKQAFGRVETTWFSGDRHGTATQGTKELQELFGAPAVFHSPKPTRLVRSLLTLAARPGDLVMDFFSGSATTAQAVLEHNRDTGEGLRFILVQFPQPTPERSAARRLGFDTIAGLGWERIRRVAARLREDGHDEGCRLFQLDDRSGEESLACQLALRLGYGLHYRVQPVSCPGVEVVCCPVSGSKAYLCHAAEVRADILDRLNLGRDDVFACRAEAVGSAAAGELAARCRVEVM